MVCATDVVHDGVHRRCCTEWCHQRGPSLVEVASVLKGAFTETLQKLFPLVGELYLISFSSLYALVVQ